MSSQILKELETLKSDKALLCQSLISAVKLTFVEKFAEGFDRPCNKDDFSSTKKVRVLDVTSVKLIIKNLLGHFNLSADNHENYFRYLIGNNDFFATVLIMCGENTTVQPWNNEIIVENCQFVLSSILKTCNCSDMSQVISKYHKESLVMKVLNLLSPNLLPTTWKCFPASVACYKWFLFMINQPVLSSFLHFVLPPALLLVDDFISENKIIGVDCLNHIVQNVATAELQFYGHGDVIYSALLPILRIREASLLHRSIPLIMLLTTKLEFNFRNENETKWSKFDSILEILLESMELEQLLELRSCYIGHLGLVIDSLKHRIIRWSKRLLRIFEEYVLTAAKCYDEKSINLSLKAIEIYLNYSEEVIHLCGKKLLYILLVGLITSNNFFSEIHIENKQKLLHCVKVIFKSMSKASFEDFKLELQENFKSNQKFVKFYEEFKNVIEEHNESMGVI